MGKHWVIIYSLLKLSLAVHLGYAHCTSRKYNHAA